jgi:hypothetical protein
MATLIQGERWRGKQAEIHKLLLASGNWSVVAYPREDTSYLYITTSAVDADYEYFRLCRFYGGRPQPPLTLYRKERGKLLAHINRCLDGNGAVSEWFTTEVARLDDYILQCAARSN